MFWAITQPPDVPTPPVAQWAALNKEGEAAALAQSRSKKMQKPLESLETAEKNKDSEAPKTLPDQNAALELQRRAVEEAGGVFGPAVASVAVAFSVLVHVFFCVQCLVKVFTVDSMLHILAWFVYLSA